MALVIKPLEWKRHDGIARGSFYWCAETIIGTYFVSEGQWRLDPNDYSPDESDSLPSDEFAKDACFDHYEERIKSAITADILPTAPLHERLYELSNYLLGEYPRDVVEDVRIASRRVKAFEVLIGRGCDHCADSIRAARDMAE